MTENSEKNQSKPWQFKPGQSGNPRGKPKGTRHHATRIVEQLLDNDAKFLGREGKRHGAGRGHRRAQVMPGAALPATQEQARQSAEESK